MTIRYDFHAVHERAARIMKMKNNEITDRDRVKEKGKKKFVSRYMFTLWGRRKRWIYGLISWQSTFQKNINAVIVVMLVIISIRVALQCMPASNNFTAFAYFIRLFSLLDLSLYNFFIILNFGFVFIFSPIFRCHCFCCYFWFSFFSNLVFFFPSYFYSPFPLKMRVNDKSDRFD